MRGAHEAVDLPGDLVLREAVQVEACLRRELAGGQERHTPRARLQPKAVSNEVLPLDTAALATAKNPATCHSRVRGNLYKPVASSSKVPGGR